LNADPTDPFEGLNTFVNDNEYFKHFEIGYTTSPWEAYYLDNLHLTLWHSDERAKLGIDNGWGAFLSFTHTIGDKWQMFARGGFAEDGGSLLKRSVSIGAGYTPGSIASLGSGSQLGFGANWGKPNDSLFRADLNDQYTLEAYYRLQVTKEFAITPDVQLLINPALNPGKDTVWVAGVRARLAF
jgi:porin